MNKVVLMGRLTADPEIRYTNGEQAVCIARYRLAVDRRGGANGEQADFISCAAFRGAGEFASKHLRKGQKIAIVGHIQTGSYEKQDGTKVYTTDVIVEEHYFCEPKLEERPAERQSYSQREDSGYQRSRPQQSQQSRAGFAPPQQLEMMQEIEPCDDEDLPF